MMTNIQPGDLLGKQNGPPWQVQKLTTGNQIIMVNLHNQASATVTCKFLKDNGFKLFTQRDIQEIKPFAPEKKTPKLTDVLKVGDFICKKSGGDDNLVVYIDDVQKVVNTQTDDGNTWIINFDNINMNYARTAGSNLPKKPTILKVTEKIRSEMFLWHYDETKEDKKYIKYCKKLERDYPKSFELIDEKKIELDYTQLLVWLQETLSPGELEKLIHDLSMKQKQSVPQSTEQ